MEIVYYVATSGDGFIADEQGGVGWLEPFQSAGEDYGFEDFQCSIDVLLTGRHTFQQALSLGPWPERKKPCLVFSAQSLPLPESNIRVTSGIRPPWMPT
jgi:dihydrofolate reductase